MKEKNPKKFAKNRHNCLQCERLLKIFLLSYFKYHQIWLNIIVNNNSHSSKIMGPNQHGHIRSPYLNSLRRRCCFYFNFQNSL
jgi:hypothetical protein